MSAAIEPPVEAADAADGVQHEEEAIQASPAMSQPVGSVDGHRVWPELKERVIGLRTMTPPLRALALLALAVLSAAFVLGLVGRMGLPETTISAAGVGPIKLPLPALVLILVGFGLAWCYAVSASLYVHALLRLAILCLFTFAMLDQGTLFSPALESARAALLVSALATQWLIVGASAVPGLRDRRMVRRWSAPFLFALTGLIQLLAWWSSNAARVPGVFAVGFVLELTVFAVLASVYLSSAGAEFAQVADLVSGSIAERCAQRSRWLLVAAAVTVACVLLTRALVGAPSSLVWNVFLCVAAGLVCVLVLLARARSRGVTRIPSWAALVTGAVLAAALTAAAALASPGPAPAPRFQLPPPTLVYHQTAAPSFSIAYPPGWKVRSLVRPSGLSEFELNGQVTGVNSLGELFAFHRTAGSATLSAPKALALVRQAETLHFRGLNVAVAATSSPYRYSLAVGVGNRVAIAGRVGLFWTPRYLWVVQVIATPLWWKPMTAVADYIVNSWRPDGSALPVDLSPAVSPRTPTAYFGVIGLGLAIALGFVLLLVPLSSRIAAALGCVFVAMLLAGLVDFREAIGLISGHYHAAGPHVNMRAIEFVVAFTIAGAVAMSLRPGRLRRQATAAVLPLAILGATVLVLSLLFSLYSGAAVGTFTVTGVTFLLAAFLWDVAFCGDVVNGDGKLIRRPARVLLYLGYLLAASAATLYFASARNLGTLKMEDAFAPEAQAALSVAFVGIAWAVVSFLGRFRAQHGEEPATPSAPEPASYSAVTHGNASAGDSTALASARSDAAP